MFSFSVLSSGSKANCIYFQSEHVRLLIDCGLSGREAEMRLTQLGVEPDSLTGILITHEHSDHLRGVGVLSRRYRLPVYANQATAEFIDKPFGVEVFETGMTFELGDLKISPFRVAHDAVDPVGFSIECGNLRYAQATDLGKVTPLVRDSLRFVDALVLESNHEPELLYQVDYPWSVKQRIASSHGHLSNQDAADLLSDIAHAHLQVLVLAHLSENSNHPELALAAASQVLHRLQLAPEIMVGSPQQQTPLYSIQQQYLLKSA